MATNTDPEELTERIQGYGVAVMMAELMIYVVYHVVATLVGRFPAQVGSVLVGLVGVYVFAVNRTLRQGLLDWWSDR